MSDKTRTVSATSNWRDSVDLAKQDCNQALDSRVDDVVSEEERDGWYLVSGSYGSYSIDHDGNRDLYRASRSKSLRFREYKKDENGLPIKIQISREQLHQIREGHLPANLQLSAEQIEEMQLAFSANTTSIAANAELGGEDFFANLLTGLDAQLPKEVVVQKGFWLLPLPRVSLTLENVKITSSRLILDDQEELTGVPLNETGQIIPYDTCGSDISFNYDEELEYERTTGYRLELKNEVSIKNEIKGELSFGTVGMSNQFSREVTFSESKEYSNTESEKRKRRVTYTVPGNSKGVVRFLAQRFEARRKFAGPVVIDCDVVAVYRDSDAAHANRHRLSALFPKESARSFIAEGYYVNLDTTVLPIKVIPQPC